tara:strand:- start:884 stop:1168 length:285 start_codon:yes stop_codon:yes gene_type:complete
MSNNDGKVGFNNLDNFLKVAPMIGLAVIAYFQSLFPSKADFDKMTQSMYQIEKQIIEIKTLQGNVDVNTKAIQDIQKTVQAMQIDIVRMQQRNN